MLSFGEREEFIIMLLLENRCLKREGENFHSYLSRHCDIETFNARYKELLDKFLTNYALNTTEKSD